MNVCDPLRLWRRFSHLMDGLELLLTVYRRIGLAAANDYDCTSLGRVEGGLGEASEGFRDTPEKLSSEFPRRSEEVWKDLMMLHHSLSMPSALVLINSSSNPRETFYILRKIGAIVVALVWVRCGQATKLIMLVPV